MKNAVDDGEQVQVQAMAESGTVKTVVRLWRPLCGLASLSCWTIKILTMKLNISVQM
jgi:hypothetical protein